MRILESIFNSGMVIALDLVAASARFRRTTRRRGNVDPETEDHSPSRPSSPTSSGPQTIPIN
uniref:Uncharacterized protein n=1 Tax=Lotus japonicus TaxID=34305 RepID=I3S2S2_LOTJA|nr:unknown [Lotus japonicus]